MRLSQHMGSARMAWQVQYPSYRHGHRPASEHGTACTRIARGPRGAYELQHERALRALRGRRDGGASHERAKAIHLLLQPRGLGALLDELGAQPLQLGAGRGLNPLEEGGQ